MIFNYLIVHLFNQSVEMRFHQFLLVCQIPEVQCQHGNNYQHSHQLQVVEPVDQNVEGLVGGHPDHAVVDSVRENENSRFQIS